MRGVVAWAALTATVAGAAPIRAWRDENPIAPWRAMASAAEPVLMPVPAEVRKGAGRLPVDAQFTARIAGHGDARLVAAVERALVRLRGRTGLELLPVRTGEGAASLTIDCGGPAPEVPVLGEDESYTLEIGDGRGTLRAPTVTGALRGLETVLQLVQSDDRGYFMAGVRIADRPRFPWRGLLIDVCRHFMPMEVLRRNIDAMAAVKLNVLHLHITEDQGFRVESKRHPRLHTMGSDGLFYTQDEIRDLVRHAALRGIRVVPEFDMPGHVTSWLVGHPELATLPGPYAIERKWGIFDPAFDPTKEEVYALLESFLGEMATLFPDAYLHIGGDENNGKHWDQSPSVQDWKRAHGNADNHAVQAHFNQRVAAILGRHGKKMAGWDEILHPDLPKDIVIQSWRGQKALAEAARQGFPGILSFGYYLDYIQPAGQHYAVDPLPADMGLDAAAAARVLGGEACMWSEFVSPETIDSRIWPRTAAIAERLWSPATVDDVDDMYRRLAVTSVRLEELGLTHERNQGMLLRRLAGGPAGEDALRALVELMEPVKVYARPSSRAKDAPYRQDTPLTRLVDAARPDAPAARRIADAVARDDRAALTAMFEEWSRLPFALAPVLAASPMLAEAGPLAADLTVLARIGREAVAALDAGRSPAGWHASATAGLDVASRPKAEVEIVVVPALRALVARAAALPPAAAR